MPKPIAERGFEVSKGNIRGGYIDYVIDKEGLECISVFKNAFNHKLESSVAITLEDGEIKFLLYETNQFEDAEDMEGEEWKIKAKQAMEIYHEVKRILNVDEELKKYSPRFSHMSEVSPFNILGIDDISQLESLISGEEK